MNWLECYTFAVKAHLPQEIRDDVAAELLSDLQDECEHRADVLGRDLAEGEVKQLLRERGHPLAVAASFRPRKTLVSESLFPVYTVILKWLVIFIAIAQCALLLVDVATHAQTNYVQSVIQLVWRILAYGLHAFAWLTLVFFLIGESLNRTNLFRYWRPELLPKASLQSKPISQTETTIELVLQLFLLGWLNQLIPGAAGESHLTLMFTSQWLALLPWINLVLGGAIIFNATILLSPYWTRRKIVINTLLCAAFVILVGIIVSWDSSMAVQVSGDNHQRIYDIPSVWIGLCGFGYQVMVIFQILRTIRRFW